MKARTCRYSITMFFINPFSSFGFLVLFLFEIPFSHLCFFLICKLCFCSTSLLHVRRISVQHIPSPIDVCMHCMKPTYIYIYIEREKLKTTKFLAFFFLAFLGNSLFKNPCFFGKENPCCFGDTCRNPCFLGGVSLLNCLKMP